MARSRATTQPRQGLSNSGTRYKKKGKGLPTEDIGVYRDDIGVHREDVAFRGLGDLATMSENPIESSTESALETEFIQELVGIMKCRSLKFSNTMALDSCRPKMACCWVPCSRIEVYAGIDRILKGFIGLGSGSWRSAI